MIVSIKGAVAQLLLPSGNRRGHKDIPLLFFDVGHRDGDGADSQQSCVLD